MLHIHSSKIGFVLESVLIVHCHCGVSGFLPILKNMPVGGLVLCRPMQDVFLACSQCSHDGFRIPGWLLKINEGICCKQFITVMQ